VKKPQKSNTVLIAIAIVALSFSALYGVVPLFLPKPSPVTAPADQFSADRAMAHVQNLSQYKRLAGSPGMEQATNYLVQTLRSCQLEPEIQDASSTEGILHNVIVRLPGAHPGDAFLIVTHVDSVSYGAGDNASGTAVLLETACNLQAGEPLSNDLILLFEDGEELGYLGGYAFVQSDPSLSSIRRVIGLDTAAWGPVVLLQTTPGNSDFIHAYAASVQNPIAFSFYADTDWTLSHDDSEIQPFFEQGIPGLDLEDPTAFAGKHSDEDTLDKVKPGSLQQMGDQVLSLSRQLGNSNLTSSSTINLSYFTLRGIGLVNYPTYLNILMIVLAGLGLIALTIQEIRQKSSSLRNLTISFVSSSLVVALAAVIGVVISMLFSKIFPNPNPNTGSYLVPASLPFFLVSLAIVTAVCLVLENILVKSRGRSAAILGGLYLWFLFAVVFSVLLPVGGYLFPIPLIIAVFVKLLPAKFSWAGVFPAMVAIVLFAPNLVLAYLGTGLQVLVIITTLLAMNVELWVGID
jgi:hypothetical protein